MPRPKKTRVGGGEPPRLLLAWLREETQIRRRLILISRHQLSIRLVDHVGFIADLYPGVVHRAGLCQPYRVRIPLTDGLLKFAPGPRQGVVDHGDVVIERVAVGLVEIEPLLDDGLVILVEGHPRDFVGARTPQEPGLDFERGVLALTSLVDPPADRVARERSFGVGGPIAAVGIDPPILIVVVAGQEVGRLPRDDDLLGLYMFIMAGMPSGMQ